MRVAWIGLGIMGAPMAARVAERFSTAVWNRTASVAAEHSRRFGTDAVELEVAAAADVLVTCLPTTADVLAVSTRVMPYLRPSALWIDCTSGDPVASKRLSSRLAELGVSYVDAPVSGMAHGARAGTLTCMVGGDEAAVDRARPVLDSFSSTVEHVGGVGAGHAVKAVNNALFALTLWGAAEALGALADADVAPTSALRAINGSSGRSAVTEDFIPKWVLRQDPPAPFRLAQAAKDIGIAAAIAEPGSLLATAAGLYNRVANVLPADAGAAEAFTAMQATRHHEG